MGVPSDYFDRFDDGVKDLSVWASTNRAIGHTALGGLSFQGSLSETYPNGYLRLQPLDSVNNAFVGYSSADNNVDFTSGELIIRVPTVDTDSNTSVHLMVAKTSNTNNRWFRGSIVRNGGTPYIEAQLFDGSSDLMSSVTYSATNHKWLRIRNVGSTYLFDTAPDGADAFTPGTWTNRFTSRTATNGMETPTGMEFCIHAWNQTNATGCLWEVDQFNVVTGALTAPEVDEGASTGATFSTITVGDVDYRVATFAGDGTLDVTSGGDFEFLIVGGGGGGGSQEFGTFGAGGGGGGGGVLMGTTRASAETLTINVGAGGIGQKMATTPKVAPTNGGDSQVDIPSVNTITSIGGGHGGGATDFGSITGEPGDGGSGGGGCGWNDATGPNNSFGGTGTAGQGFAGGRGDYDGGVTGGGGGGGAGAAGSDANLDGTPGDGGDGVASSITGTSTYYGGGGGGAQFGSFSNGGLGGGGGGGGGDSGEATPGTDGLGGGGGGETGEAFAASAFSNDGGDGVVIIRWLASAAGTAVAVFRNNLVQQGIQ